MDERKKDVCMVGMQSWSAFGVIVAAVGTTLGGLNVDLGDNRN